MSYQSLAARGVTLLGHLESAAGTRLRFSDDLAECLSFADERSAWFRRRVDEHVERLGIAAPPSEPDPADEPIADVSRYTGPAEMDLRDRGIGSVIMSTGFSGDLSYLKLPVTDERGVPIHTDLRSPVEGLWWVGFPWLRYRGSGVIPGVLKDSAIIASEITARASATA